MHGLLSAPRTRREFLRQMFLSAGALSAPAWLAACEGSPVPAGGVAGRSGNSRFAGLGPLQPADANGLMLPEGFSSRVVAVSGQPAALGSNYVWHTFPDGGATYPTADGGWVYTSNSEVPGGAPGGISGGCGALRFDAQGNVVDSYSILSGTRGNCAGGKMPWGTWMSCEETPDGLVYECDPFAAGNGVVRPMLGVFNHEAVAVDPLQRVFYLTEDAGAGRFYRYVPDAADWPAGASRPALEPGMGRLQVARFVALAPDQVPPAEFDVAQPQAIVWDDVVSPELAQATVRAGLAAAPGTPFDGGEGLWYRNGLVYFSTKGDSRIWVLDVTAQTIEAIYDFASAAPENAILTGVDNLTVSEFGDVLVAEDGGDMDLCVILPDRNLLRLLKASDASAGTPAESELTGPAFSPDGTRLYFSAQRNGRNGAPGNGITFEVTLPFSACPTREC